LRDTVTEVQGKRRFPAKGSQRTRGTKQASTQNP